ncbi:MAG: hypothetical protein KY395_06780 [Actinobacteria bacterium]|nr:hypothetical protein [Actinomycetota bacterium]
MPHQSRSVEAIFGFLRSTAWRGSSAVLFVIVLAGALGGCASDQPRVPTGDPLSVVKAAPEQTTSAGPVTVVVSAPDEDLEGRVDLATGEGPLEVRRHADIALERVGRAAKAVPYGGQQVRGASTMRYEVTTAEGSRIDVWIDVEGRVRRVELPDAPADAPPEASPPTQPNGLPALVTVDFVFPAADPAESPRPGP